MSDDAPLDAESGEDTLLRSASEAAWEIGINEGDRGDDGGRRRVDHEKVATAQTVDPPEDGPSDDKAPPHGRGRTRARPAQGPA